MTKKIKNKKSLRQIAQEEKLADPLYQEGQRKTNEQVFRAVIDNMTRKAIEQAKISGRDFNEEKLRSYFRDLGIKAAKKGLLKSETGITTLSVEDVT